MAQGKSPQSVDPGIAGSQAAQEAEKARQGERPTGHKLGFNSNGDPEEYPSDVLSLQSQYGLTQPEASELLRRGVWGSENLDSVANELVANRVVYRQVYEQVVNPADHALTANLVNEAKIQKEIADTNAKAKAASPEVKTPTADRTQPEAGPYGPFTDYPATTVPVAEVAHNTGLSTKQVKEVVGE